MAIGIIGKDTLAAKEKTCSHCGSKLRYMPIDIQKRIDSDYTGCKEEVRFIKCPYKQYNK